MDKIIIYTDGGSRGNPGPAAIGAVIEDKSVFASWRSQLAERKKNYGESIGKATNNEAEYQAVIFALRKTKQLLGKVKSKEAEIELMSDSKLLINQLNGEFKIKEKKLQEFFIEIWNLKQDFKKVIFIQIPREENEAADKLVNQALDNLF